MQLKKMDFNLLVLSRPLPPNNCAPTYGPTSSSMKSAACSSPAEPAEVASAVRLHLRRYRGRDEPGPHHDRFAVARGDLRHADRAARGRRTDRGTFLAPPEIDALLVDPDPTAGKGHATEPSSSGPSSLAFESPNSPASTAPTSPRAPRQHPLGRQRTKATRRPSQHPTAGLLRSWLRERAGRPGGSLFPTRMDQAAPQPRCGRAAGQYPLGDRGQLCPSLAGKKIHPHVLRHSYAISPPP